MCCMLQASSHWFSSGLELCARLQTLNVCLRRSCVDGPTQLRTLTRQTRLAIGVDYNLGPWRSPWVFTAPSTLSVLTGAR